MRKAIIVTGCFGLVGGEVSKHLANKGFKILGIDCDIRPKLFKGVAPLSRNDVEFLKHELHIDVKMIDIRDKFKLEEIVETWASTYNIVGVIHTAAQPSHDWAADNVIEDFEINARGTLNLLETIRKKSINSIFINFSTNKVYGDNPNLLPLREEDTRYEVDNKHVYYNGIDEKMPIDHTKHSLFGVSKTTADLYSQEYARYYGMKSIVLRGGCLTGAKHRGHKLHGFLNYLVKCALLKDTYTIIGYKGKQVRDNLDARDIAELMEKILEENNLKNHMEGESKVFNMGGGRKNSTSIIEAINILKDDFGIKMNYTLDDKNRKGDHIWYISSNSKLYENYSWEPKIQLRDTIKDILENINV